jgi:hypothetical protein
MDLNKEGNSSPITVVSSADMDVTVCVFPTGVFPAVSVSDLFNISWTVHAVPVAMQLSDRYVYLSAVISTRGPRD